MVSAAGQTLLDDGILKQVETLLLAPVLSTCPWGLEARKLCVKCIKLIWQHDLTHDTSCFCSLWCSGSFTTCLWCCWCWLNWRETSTLLTQLNIFRLHFASLMSVTLWWCCRHLSIHPSFLVGEWVDFLCDSQTSNTFADVQCYWWCVFFKDPMAASLNTCQSVYSNDMTFLISWE